MIPLPNKKYSIVYADPPREYQQGGRGAAKHHYETISTEALCKMPVRAHSQKPAEARDRIRELMGGITLT